MIFWKNGIESVETGLGEYIQQLDGEPPYHIVTPAMHKSKEDVANSLLKNWAQIPKLYSGRINPDCQKTSAGKICTG